MILRRLITTIAVLAMCIIASHAIAVKDIPNVHKLDRKQYVSDPMNYLSPEAKSQANAILADIWSTTSAEPVVIIVDSLDGVDSFDASMQLFDLWGIGKSDKQNGLVMLIDMEGNQGSLITGRGIEGVLPDVYCARIMRDTAFPLLREGDVDGAILQSLNAVRDIVNQPEAADELMSKYANDSAAKPDEGNIFALYLYLVIFVTVIMIIIVIARFISTRGDERHLRFAQLQRLNMPYLMLTFVGIGIPVVAWLLLKLIMNRVRRSVPKCDNCGHRMRLIDEVHDNDYLTPAQDREEQLNSVDYDVWHCDNCEHNLILPYVNPQSGYKQCPRCGSHAERLISNRVIVQPTYDREGVGEKTYHCNVCNNERKERYRIPPIERPPSAGAFAAGAILGSMLGGRGGSSGGGFSGGSFGGGGSAGGGFSGKW